MTRIKQTASGVVALFTLVSVANLANASAFDPARTPILGGHQGPQDGPPRGDRGGRRRPEPPAPSAATVPVEVYSEYLSLSEAQQTKIKTIQDTLREAMRPPRPTGDGNPEDGRPMPPSQEEREAHRKTQEAAIKKANESVTALLNDDQKTKMATLLKAFDALKAGRIPPQALRDLKLTGAQWSKFSELGGSATSESIRSVLTADQIKVLESARQRRGGPGGPPDGGPGGPPDGGPGGPPPGGPDGPPPGDF